MRPASLEASKNKETKRQRENRAFSLLFSDSLVHWWFVVLRGSPGLLEFLMVARVPVHLKALPGLRLWSTGYESCPERSTEPESVCA